METGANTEKSCAGSGDLVADGDEIEGAAANIGDGAGGIGSVKDSNSPKIEVEIDTAYSVGGRGTGIALKLHLLTEEDLETIAILSTLERVGGDRVQDVRDSRQRPTGGLIIHNQKATLTESTGRTGLGGAADLKGEHGNARTVAVDKGVAVANGVQQRHTAGGAHCVIGGGNVDVMHLLAADLNRTRIQRQLANAADRIATSGTGNAKPVRGAENTAPAKVSRIRHTHRELSRASTASRSKAPTNSASHVWIVVTFSFDTAEWTSGRIQGDSRGWKRHYILTMSFTTKRGPEVGPKVTGNTSAVTLEYMEDDTNLAQNFLFCFCVFRC